MKDILQLDAIGQAQLVKNGHISSRELLELTISAIEKLEPGINALASQNFSAARKKSENPLTDDVFSGVPFLVKDTINYPGLPFRLGSRLFAQNFLPEPTPYSERIDASGLIVLGKSATSEFGLLGSTESLLNGITVNPWQKGLSASGSSGGSAAAVACGMVPFAHASDAGGSVRIPASVNGLFGFKPSAGHSVTSSLMQNPFLELVSDHCLSKSVRDSAAFWNATAKNPDISIPLAPDKAPLFRIGAYHTSLMGETPCDEILQAHTSAIRLCRDLGHEVIEIPAPPLNGKGISESFFTLAGFSMSETAKMMQGIMNVPINDYFLEPFTLSLIDWFHSLPSACLDNSRNIFSEQKRIMESSFAEFDILLSPVLGLLPQPTGFLSPQLDFAEAVRRTEQYAGFTPIHNIAALPAMSVPLHVTDTGLPVGSHFTAPFGNDARLFHLAYQLEQASPWQQKLPFMR